MARKKRPVGEDGQPLDTAFLRSVGGEQLALMRQAWSTPTGHTSGGETVVWNFGWLPEEMRTEQQHEAHEAAVGLMPRFLITGTPAGDANEDGANLTATWKHAEVIAANGSEFTGTHQLTGSCVGAGGGNMWATLAFHEAIVGAEPELPKVPFWLLPYGRSRYYCGMKTPGEGSLGSCFARAAVEDGTLEYDRAGLPQPTSRDDGWIWGRNVELSWSDGDARQSLDALEHSRKHLIKTAAQCRSASDVWQALTNGYPVTCASMYAHNGGRVQGEGKDAVLLASRSGSWAHQMSILACRKHPQFGNLFWLHNQWGLRAHGICPTGMPPGGVWIKASDVDWICRDEVYAFSAYSGFPSPAKPIPWTW
jgi:hypothetical protein